MPETNFDLVVIGAGPGGYHAAIRGAQLGLSIAIVEKDDGSGIAGIGGVCLNWGCIPSKSLLKNAELVNTLSHADDWGISFDNFSADISKAIDRSRKVSAQLVQGIGYLLKQNKIEVFRGAATLTSATTVSIDDGTTLTGKSIVISTGARARSLPGLEIDGEKIITSREALETRVAPKAIGIIGGGAIGAEFAYFFRAYGAEVTIFEMLPHLMPLEDEDVSVELERAFKKQGINFVTSARVNGAEKRGAGMVINYHANGKDSEFVCDKVLLGVGVQPNTDSLGLESAGVMLDARGFIEIDDRMQTSAPGVYAVGDVTGKLLLAHVAFAQGVVAAEAIAGRDPEPSGAAGVWRFGGVSGSAAARRRLRAGERRGAADARCAGGGRRLCRKRWMCRWSSRRRRCGSGRKGKGATATPMPTASDSSSTARLWMLRRLPRWSPRPCASCSGRSGRPCAGRGRCSAGGPGR